MRFESPWALLILLAIPLVLWLRRRRQGGSVRFSTTANASRAGRSLRQRLLWLPTGLRVTALVLFAVALARPQEGRERVSEASEGVIPLGARSTAGDPDTRVVDKGATTQTSPVQYLLLKTRQQPGGGPKDRICDVNSPRQIIFSNGRSSKGLRPRWRKSHPIGPT